MRLSSPYSSCYTVLVFPQVWGPRFFAGTAQGDIFVVPFRFVPVALIAVASGSDFDSVSVVSVSIVEVLDRYNDICVSSIIPYPYGGFRGHGGDF